MRVELIYTPGCRSYRKALHILEMVIAEERLPLPVELIEEGTPDSLPKLKINGEHVAVPGCPTSMESFRDALSQKWHDMMVRPLTGV